MHPSWHVRLPGSFYTLIEELVNAIIHGLGTLLALAGAAVLIVRAALTGDPWKTVSASIYSGALILLFLMSTLYHALIPAKAKGVFRVFDHAAIFLLIAGTYTPLTLVTLRGGWGWAIFGAVWGFGLLGITLNAISVERYKRFSLICYLAMGWVVAVAIKPLLSLLPTGGLALLALGGLAYTAGVYFYQKKNTRFMHSVWHVFVLAGAALHYFSILFYVV
ncbi:MAG: hemolysin III family protein [Peptococcaceae bacterium]|jgi:hemolysin III|nr:hemolysin III family protein [Peptococcaceae bacterium]